MNEIVLFGNKENFAIELGLSKTPQRSYLCFWTMGKRLGTFTRSGELKYSIRAYLHFLANKDDFYNAIFDAFSPSEIDHFLIGYFFTEGRGGVSDEETEERMKLGLIFGDQFANENGSFSILYKDKKVIFIINRPMKGPVYRCDIDFKTFCYVFEEYIAYANAHNLK